MSSLSLDATSVILNNPAQEWLQVVAALGIPTVLLIAAVVTVVSRSWRRKAECRAEWWSRAQWALDFALSDEPRKQKAGRAALQLLGDSELAGRDELRIAAEASAFLECVKKTGSREQEKR